MTPEDGGEWLVAGEPVSGNPRLTISQPWHDFVRLWAACRGGMGGIAHWPDGGGVGDQAAWVVDAFGMLAGIDARLDEAARSTNPK